MRLSVRVAWTLTVCTALALLGDATLYAVLPATYDTVGVALWQVGWLLSVNRLARIPLNLPSGWLSDRIGPRGPYILGVAIGALSTLGYSLPLGFGLLLLMRALWGLAWSLLVVAAYGMLLDTAALEERGRLSGLYAGGSFFGGAIGAMLGGFLIDALGFRAGMRILGLLTLLGVALALTLPRPPHQRGRLSWSALRDRAAFWPAARVQVRALLGALRQLDARLWLILALNFGQRFFFAGIFYATFGLFLRYTLGEEITLAGATVGVAALTGTLLFVRNLITVLGGPALGYLSDRLGDRTRVLMLGEGLGALGLVTLAAAALALGGAAPLVLLGVTLVALAYGVVPPMLVAWIGDLTPVGGRGKVVGGYQTMGDLGSGLGPLAAYALVAAWGTGPMYLVSGLIIALTVPLILRARRR